jgi:hypothetical protein
LRGKRYCTAGAFFQGLGAGVHNKDLSCSLKNVLKQRFVILPPETVGHLRKARIQPRVFLQRQLLCAPFPAQQLRLCCFALGTKIRFAKRISIIFPRFSCSLHTFSVSFSPCGSGGQCSSPPLSFSSSAMWESSSSRCFRCWDSFSFSFLRL